MSVLHVRIGDELGFYRTLKEAGPLMPEELGEPTGCNPCYIREWLSAQAASGYVTHKGRRFSLSPGQAMVFAEPDSPVALIGASTRLPR